MRFPAGTACWRKTMASSRCTRTKPPTCCSNTRVRAPAHSTCVPLRCRSRPDRLCVMRMQTRTPRGRVTCRSQHRRPRRCTKPRSVAGTQAPTSTGHNGGCPTPYCARQWLCPYIRSDAPLANRTAVYAFASGGFGVSAGRRYVVRACLACAVGVRRAVTPCVARLTRHHLQMGRPREQPHAGAGYRPGAGGLGHDRARVRPADRYHRHVHLGDDRHQERPLASGRRHRWVHVPRVGACLRRSSARDLC